MNEIMKAFSEKELVEINGKKFIVNPLTEQIPATTPELLKDACEEIIKIGNFDKATKIVGEEEKGGIIVAGVSLLSNIPFGMARWYPSGLKGQIEIDFKCEYTSGKLYLNGVEKGDKVIIVDDMISTGGTMIALINAIKKAGADIIDIICVAEKLEYQGVKKIKEKTGFDVKTLVKISMKGEKSEVISKIKFNKEGLIPVIAQDAENNKILMLAYANNEAIDKTIETKKGWYWSRSRKKLWMKGETSGNTQEVKEILIDCDNDALIYKIKQQGNACHTGRKSCFRRWKI